MVEILRSFDTTQNLHSFFRCTFGLYIFYRVRTYPDVDYIRLCCVLKKKSTQFWVIFLQVWYCFCHTANKVEVLKLKNQFHKLNTVVASCGICHLLGVGAERRQGGC